MDPICALNLFERFGGEINLNGGFSLLTTEVVGAKTRWPDVTLPGFFMGVPGQLLLTWGGKWTGGNLGGGERECLRMLVGRLLVLR